MNSPSELSSSGFKLNFRVNVIAKTVDWLNDEVTFIKLQSDNIDLCYHHVWNTYIINKQIQTYFDLAFLDNI